MQATYYKLTTYNPLLSYPCEPHTVHQITVLSCTHLITVYMYLVCKHAHTIEFIGLEEKSATSNRETARGMIER